MGCGSSGYKVNVLSDIRPSADWLLGQPNRVISLSHADISPSTPIGKGKFGNVFMARHIPSSKYCAVKYISKQIIYDCQCLTRIQQEIDILQIVNHPFIIRFYGGYETPFCVALAFEFAVGGELFTRMKSVQTMPEEQAKFYFCEIALALHYLHDELNVVFRDLKPENILLDCHGHAKICDFGFAVPLGTDKESLHDGCGTAMYVAPEIAGGFMKQAHGFPVDWWSLGCILMEMTTGAAPFGDTEKMSKFEVFNNINGMTVRYPMFMSGALKALLGGLLERNAARRLSFPMVKASKWLAGMDWDNLMSFRVMPPWIPPVTPQPSAANFVKWDGFLDPNQAGDLMAVQYCKGLTIPKPKLGADSGDKWHHGKHPAPLTRKKSVAGASMAGIGGAGLAPPTKKKSLLVGADATPVATGTGSGTGSGTGAGTPSRPNRAPSAILSTADVGGHKKHQHGGGAGKGDAGPNAAPFKRGASTVGR